MPDEPSLPALDSIPAAAPTTSGHPPEQPPEQQALLERIVRLRHPGVLQNFSWPASLQSFKRFNLVYGWNGTGKTTLSELLRALGERRIPSATNVLVRANGRDIRGEDFPSCALPIRVFNRAFVSRNVFPEGGGGTLPLILVLGEEKIEKQKTLEALKTRAAAVQAKVESATAENVTAEGALDAHCVDRATAVREPLRAAKSEFNNFNKTDYRRRAEKIAAEGNAAALVLADAVRASAQAQHRGTPKDELQLPLSDFPDVSALKTRVDAVRAQSVTSQSIDALRSDPELSRWTKDGLELHRHRGAEHCLFCDQQLPSGRLSQLEAHFSTAFRDLDRGVKDLRQVISAEDAALERLVFPKRAQLLDHLANDYEQALRALEAQVATVRSNLAVLRDAVDEKSQRLFESLPHSQTLQALDSAPLKALDAIVQKHNSDCQSFDERAKDARRLLADDVIASAQTDFARLVAAKASKEAAVSAAVNERTSLRNEIEEAEREVASHRRPGEELNDDLREYLGHSDLELTITDAGYLVSRNGAPAVGLSEGEQSAIALLYFLKHLQDQSFDLRRGVVVLDDPVSSLDSSALFMAYGFIRARLQEAGQVIVLTHNFSFFRLVRNWLWFPHERREHAALYMLEAGIHDGNRCAQLVKLPHLLRDFESEYHYLFSRVFAEARSGASAALEAQYPMPNVARRLLESYLAFRQPDGKSLESKINAMNGNAATKARVLRFVHVHSHGEGVPEPEHDLSLLGEARPVMQDVLALLEADDAAHFVAMKRACGLT